MTNEEKDLLLKDLCSRLPYGVMASTKLGSNIIVSFIGDDIIKGEDGDSYDISFIKPYLRPMSSMTDDQQKEANIFDDMDIDILKENLERNHRNKTNIPTATYNYIDWLNAHHFDYRGLIEEGLAIDAPEGMYDTKYNFD